LSHLSGTLTNRISKLGIEAMVMDATETAVPALAWSLDDADDDATERYTWGMTWAHAGVVLMCAVVLAGAIGFGGWAWMMLHSNDIAQRVVKLSTSPPPSASRDNSLPPAEPLP
jgi:hypothetical protein